MTIVIANRRIEAIGPADSLALARGDSVIDASGLWAIPGLFDAHVHLTKAGPEALPVLVSLGVTTVRDMGGDLEELRTMQAAIAAGETVGPHMLVAGPMLEAPATIERLAKSATSEPYLRTRIPIPDTMRAREVVDSLADLGVDFIKIREYESEATYRAVVAAAHENGLPIAGHAPFSMDPVQGARLGMVSFEHASYPYPLDTVPARRREILSAFRESGTAIVPTLVAWTTNVMDPDSLALLVSDEGPARDPRLRLVSPGLLHEWKVDLDEQGARSSGYYAGYWGFIDRMSEDLLAMYRAGIPLVAGSDLASIALVPGYSLHEELEDLVELVGLTPLEAISSATLVPARMMSVADSLGSLEPGKLADLVLLESDPTADIRNTRTVRAVVLDGTYLSETRLDELRDGVSPTATGGIGLVRWE
jgi:imidazolonepropionase-like amidohydrolase